MRVLFLGDVLGRSGREAIYQRMPKLRAELGLDFVVINGENAAGGFGITGKICAEFYAAGVDCITGGNHSWDQREVMAYIPTDPKLLRPINFPPGTPGTGFNIYKDAKGRRILVLNVLCRLFMDALDDPFAAVAEVLDNHKLKRDADFILIDVHGEATSEKQSLGHFADGRASMVVGSHSHVPTADHWILPGGTAYQTDAGMCGDYDSIIGMKKESAMQRFITKLPGERFTASEGEATLCGTFVESDDASGFATYVAPLRIGGKLAQAWPLSRPAVAVAE